MSDAATRPKRALKRADPEQSDFWIVTEYKFFQHATLEGAEAERGRLHERFPDKQFRVHRCKRHLPGRVVIIPNQTEELPCPANQESA